jgi:hypothetical protein
VTGARAAALAALAAAIGCGGAAPPAVVIDDGPIVVIREGASRWVPVRIDGDGAGPLTVTTTPAPGGASVFDLPDDALLVEVGARGLRLRPRCDVVGPGQPDALVMVTVAGRGLAPATLMVEIADEPGPTCAPAVVAWAPRGPAPCGEPPPATTTTVAITPDVHRLCLAVAARDPARERWSLRTDTTAPETLLDPAALPTADDRASERYELAVGASLNIRGRFAFRPRVHRAAPAIDVEPDLVLAVTGGAGAAPTAIELLGDPGPVAELDARSVDLRLWHLDELPPGQGTCARMTRALPARPRGTKPPARLHDRESGAAVDLIDVASPWLCGHELRLGVSPGPSARPTEMVRLEATVCDCPAAVARAEAAVVDRAISYPTIDTVEDLAPAADCATTAGSGQYRWMQAGCADVDGDGSVEVVASHGDAGPGYTRAACGYRTDPDGRLVPAVFDVAAPPPFKAVWSLLVRSPSGGPPEPAVLASFADGVRRLRWTGQALRWEPLFAAGAITDLVALAEVPAEGATHVAYQTATHTLRVRCIAELCAEAGALPWFDVDPGLEPGLTWFGLAAGDVLGRGSPDVVLFTKTDGTDVIQLRARVLELAWTAGRLVPAATPGPESNPVTIAGGLRLSTASAPKTCGGPCARPHDLVYAAQAMPEQQVAVLYRLDMLASQLDERLRPISVPGAANALTVLDGALHAALTTGVWRGEATATGFASWALADPSIVERLQPGAIVQQAEGYGDAVAACVGGPPAFVVSTSRDDVRFARAGTRVADP